MKVVLELQDQPSNVRRVTVRHDIVIGRGSDCNLRLSAPQISRRHCFLRVGRESVSVTDLDSSNGTFVDGTRIKPGKRYDLSNGASLALGPIRFLIHIREEVVASDVLLSGSQGSQVQMPSADHSADSSTLIENSGGADSDSQFVVKPMNLSVERGGVSSKEDDPTADYGCNLNGPTTERSQKNKFLPELMDSRAEIVDLGRRIAELDDDFTAANQMAPPKEVAEKPTVTDQVIHEDADLLEVIEENSVLQPTEMAYFVDDSEEASLVSTDDVEFVGDIEVVDEEVVHEIVDVVDNEVEVIDETAEEVIDVNEAEIFDEVIEVLDEPELLLGEEHDAVVDVVELADDEQVEIVDADSSEEVEVLEVPDDSLDTKATQNWFGGDADDEDIDPNLNSFLKGL